MYWECSGVCWATRVKIKGRSRAGHLHGSSGACEEGRAERREPPCFHKRSDAPRKGCPALPAEEKWPGLSLDAGCLPSSQLIGSLSWARSKGTLLVRPKVGAAGRQYFKVLFGESGLPRSNHRKMPRARLPGPACVSVAKPPESGGKALCRRNSSWFIHGWARAGLRCSVTEPSQPPGNKECPLRKARERRLRANGRVPPAAECSSHSCAHAPP